MVIGSLRRQRWMIWIVMSSCLLEVPGASWGQSGAPPNRLADLQALQRELLLLGQPPYRDNAGRFTLEAAKRFADFTALEKTTGNQWMGFSTDVLCYPSTGQIVDIIRDADGPGAAPQWLVSSDRVDLARCYDPAGPPPPPTPPPPTPFTKEIQHLLDQMAVVVASVQALEQTQTALASEIRSEQKLLNQTTELLLILFQQIRDDLTLLEQKADPDYRGRLFGWPVVLRPVESRLTTRP